MMTTNNVKNKWMGFKWQNQIRTIVHRILLDEWFVCEHSFFHSPCCLWLLIFSNDNIKPNHIKRAIWFVIYFMFKCASDLLVPGTMFACRILFIFIFRNRRCIWLSTNTTKTTKIISLSFFLSFFRVIKYVLFAERWRERERSTLIRFEHKTIPNKNDWCSDSLPFGQIYSHFLFLLIRRTFCLCPVFCYCCMFFPFRSYVDVFVYTRWLSSDLLMLILMLYSSSHILFRFDLHVRLK